MLGDTTEMLLIEGRQGFELGLLFGCQELQYRTIHVRARTPWIQSA
jgi:hypothetical protein